MVEWVLVGDYTMRFKEEGNKVQVVNKIVSEMSEMSQI